MVTYLVTIQYLALMFIDELVEKGIIKPIRLHVWNGSIIVGMATYNLTYDESLLHIIKTSLNLSVINFH